VGIGFGPANISIAIAHKEIFKNKYNIKFLEAAKDSSWQPNMLLDGSDIQNNPLRDLVTPRNPKSNYTFVNYLHENDRFFEYLNLGIKYPLRKEYSKYIEWVAKHFSEYVSYNNQVKSIKIGKDNTSKTSLCTIETKLGQKIKSKGIILAAGRTPYIPKVFNNIKSRKIQHSKYYLSAIKKFQKNSMEPSRIAVVGGSQSSVEIILDLANKFPNAEIHNFVRKYSIRLKDTSPFSYEVYYPSFVDYFRKCTKKSQQEIRDELVYTNYSSVDSDILNQLYLKIYEKRLDNKGKIFVINKSSITNVENNADKTINITYLDKHHNTSLNKSFDFVILATGFKDIGTLENQELYPDLLKDIAPFYNCDTDGVLQVNDDYSLIPKQGNFPLVYLNGLCETSHGLGDAGSFSSLAIRSKNILESINEKF
jgi:L-ornithine N5-oxygenase